MTMLLLKRLGSIFRLNDELLSTTSFSVSSVLINANGIGTPSAAPPPSPKSQPGAGAEEPEASRPKASDSYGSANEEEAF